MGNSVHIEMRESIINKILQEDYDHIIESDKEFYYLAGQCIRYMAHKYVKIFMQGKIRENQVVKFILTSKDAIKLKENLKRMLMGKCSNLIYMDKDKKFNNCFAMLINYIPEDNKINQDFLQIGYLETNIL